MELDESLRQKAINELLCYKKITGRDLESVVKLFLLDVDDYFVELKDKDIHAYQKIKAELVDEIQKLLDSETDDESRKGVSVRKERWCFPGYLKTDYYWDKFKEMMSDWSEMRWNAVENQTFEIVNFLQNPMVGINSEKDSSVKGLVYGNVQSGKTAHIASIISLYSSMGCPLIIVFSGVTKSLRLQTENRLRNDLGIDKYGTFDLITAETDLLSIKTPRIVGKIYGRKQPVLGVFKKSPAALSRLLEYLQSTNDIHFWKGKQVLIIDDECDQYGPNNKPMYTDKEDAGHPCDRSTINGLLVSIMNIFDRYCYIGFTATPFANILNELPGKDSIYPKDFIYPLDLNTKYYGAQKIFGSSNDDPDKKVTVLNAIEEIEPNELNPKVNSYNVLPSSIKEAVYYFIVATACKYYRKMDGDHSSMLLHVDLKKDTHSRATWAMQKFVNDEIKPYTEETKKALRKTWEKSKDKIRLDVVEKLFNYTKKEISYYKRPSFDEMTYYVKQVINKLEIVKDNSDVRMEDRLSYPNDRSVVYIVIGGNTLSRGLTLEGLLVSVFYRTSSSYDTLLQMGRWFGYRIGYEDLARIYTTPKIAFKYSELADVEENLRSEFEKYNLDITPERVAVRIRRMPLLQITRKMAMQAAISTGINYSGSRPSTLFFPHYDRDWLRYNIEKTKAFLEKINKPAIEKNNAFIIQNVDITDIRQYVETMNIDIHNRECNKELLLKFIDKACNRGYLSKWNVAVMSNTKNTNGVLELRKDIKVNMIERSRLNRKDPIEETVYLKVLQQPNNMFLDTDLNDVIPDNTPVQAKFIKRHKYFVEKGIEEPGLMVIYPISKDSIPEKYDPTSDENHRLPLDTPEDVIGLMFTFPFSKDIELDEYMTIALPKEIEDED